MLKQYPILSQPILIPPIFTQAYKQGVTIWKPWMDKYCPKSETRRMTGLKYINEDPDQWNVTDLIFPESKQDKAWAIFSNGKETKKVKCPYGTISTPLWIKTAWCVMDGELFYKGLNTHPEYLTWKSSLFLKKAKATIWVQINEIRLERLCNISQESAKNEGIEYQSRVNDKPIFKDYLTNEFTWRNPINSFESLIEKINGLETTYLNPWVWVLKFKVLSVDGRPTLLTNQESNLQEIKS